MKLPDLITGINRALHDHEFTEDQRRALFDARDVLQAEVDKPRKTEPGEPCVEVFYVDRRNGWACARFDADGFQIGDALFAWAKALAIMDAYDLAGPGVPVKIYTASGRLLRTETPKKKET